MGLSAYSVPIRAVTIIMMLGFPVLSGAAGSSTDTLAAPLKSYFTFESSGDSSGDWNYKVDIDHALDSGNRLSLVATRSVVSIAAQKFHATAFEVGFGTDSSDHWSHHGTYEFAAMGKNLDSHSLAYSLSWNSDHWGIKATPELGRIGVFAGSPLIRVDIDRLGLELELNYYTDGPWRFLFSAVANNYYGDVSKFPRLIFIVRSTSAGLFITNFYKTRYGAEVGYDFEHVSVAFGAEQILTGNVTAKSLYFSVEGSLSDSLSLRSEFGRSYAGTTGSYGTIGITYAY